MIRQPVMQATTTIPSGSALIPPTDGRLGYVGATDFGYGAVSPDTTLFMPASKFPHTYGAQSSWGVEFRTDASDFEFLWKYTAAIAMFRLTVDGVRGELQPCKGYTLGSRHVTRIFLGCPAPRKVRLDFYSMPFGGIFLSPGASMWPVFPQQPRLIVFGDSICGGSSPQNDGMGQGTWVSHLGCLREWDAWNQGIGGTGYLTAGQGVKHGDRLATDVLAYLPEKVIMFGAYNDRGLNQTTLRAEADLVHAQLAAAVSTLVVGCWSQKGTPDANVVATDETIRASALACSLPFVSPVTGSIYHATGTLLATHGPWVTPGNQTAMVGNDATHPTNAGHANLAARVDAALDVIGW